MAKKKLSRTVDVKKIKLTDNLKPDEQLHIPASLVMAYFGDDLIKAVTEYNQKKVK